MMMSPSASSGFSSSSVCCTMPAGTMIHIAARLLQLADEVGQAGRAGGALGLQLLDRVRR